MHDANEVETMSRTNSEFMLTADVAREKAVTPATVRQWERSGKLPAIKTVTGVRLFNRSDVEAFAGTRKRTRS